jgi:triacylglycerol lipase
MMKVLASIAFVVLLLSLLMAACGSQEGAPSKEQAADDDSDLGDDDGLADDDSGDDDTGIAGTQYPIVLVHGFMGWGYLGPLSNFYEVQDTLTANGFEVFEPWVSAINSMDERARELAEKIEQKYPGQRINIISHSQGGLDARYLISTLGWGDRVASLTTLSAPHQGTTLADIACGLVPGFAQSIIDLLFNLFGMDWDGISQLTTEYVRNEFNPANPDDPRVAYYSYHGNGEDMFLPLELTHAILWMFEGCNDGVIGCESATYGINLGELPVDHWAIIGQPFGLVRFDHLKLFLDLAFFLKAQGY